MKPSDATAAAIRAELGRQNKSRAQLARHLGVTEMWVSRRLSGATPLSVDDIVRIAQGLGVTAADFLPPDKASA